VVICEFFVQEVFDLFFVCLYFYVRSFLLFDFFVLLALFVGMRVFDLFAMTPCLWWESEKTHVYFSTCLFVVPPNFSIISLNWAILAWMFSGICATLLIVIFLFTADAKRAVLVSVLEGFDASEILGLLDLFISIL